MTKSFFSIALLLCILFAGGNAPAGAAAEKEKALPRFSGEVKSVDCATGEVRIDGKSGEEVFSLGNAVRYRNVKSCGEIRKGGKVFIRYAEEDGKKKIELLTYIGPTGQARARGEGGPPLRKRPVFLGWVTGIDCGKGTITLARIDDKSKQESFRFSAEVFKNWGMGPATCGEIKKDTIAAVVYEEVNGGKVLKSISITKIPGGKS